jgi:hypothetical protein
LYLLQRQGKTSLLHLYHVTTLTKLSTKKLPYAATFMALHQNGRFLFIAYANTHISVLDTLDGQLRYTSAKPLHDFALTCLLPCPFHAKNDQNADEVDSIVDGALDTISTFHADLHNDVIGCWTGSPDMHFRFTLFQLADKETTRHLILYYLWRVLPVLLAFIVIILYKSYQLGF